MSNECKSLLKQTEVKFRRQLLSFCRLFVSLGFVGCQSIAHSLNLCRAHCLLMLFSFFSASITSVWPALIWLLNFTWFYKHLCIASSGWLACDDLWEAVDLLGKIILYLSVLPKLNVWSVWVWSDHQSCRLWLDGLNCLCGELKGSCPLMKLSIISRRWMCLSSLCVQ